MGHRKLLILLLVLFFVSTAAHAQLFKTVDVGKLQAFVYDHGCMSEDVRPCGNVYYYRGSYITWDDVSFDDGFEWPGGLLKDAGLLFGARNWTDTAGYTWDARLTGHAARKRADQTYQFVVPDEEGFFIRRYMRYPLPQVIVDGDNLTPSPMSGDEVAPEKIWGTADVMIESNVRMNMGLDVKQRVLAWSQPGHDDYIIWDWTFVNSGNVDEDDEIELPGQTLEDVYITRVTEALINGTGNNKVMPTWAGTTVDHDTRLSYPQDDDSLRIHYVTPLRAGEADYDSYGKNPGTSRNLLDGARFGGTAVLFAPQSCDVQQFPNTPANNDPAQPSMHSSLITEPSWIVWDFPGLEEQDYIDAYGYMVRGAFAIDSSSGYFYDEVYYMDSVYNVYQTTASGAETHYEQPLDRWGEFAPLDPGFVYTDDIPYIRFDVEGKFSIGPYDMAFGDTLRYVYAYVGGSISRKTSYLLGEAWNNGNAASYGWLAEMDSATIADELAQRDPIFNVYGETELSLALNDIAKDLMVASGRDSLFNNGMNAQRNFNANYNIPASPEPPTVFEVVSQAENIKLSWSYDGGVPSDVAGFKIYRASGGYVFEKQGEVILGNWQLHDSVGADVDVYEDTEGITAGADYFYALTAFNDQGVESGMFLTMTTKEARLSAKVSDSLEMARVVPNPLHIGARGGYDEGGGHKLTFANLPGPCWITIMTESGELVTKIDHDSETGIAQWFDGQRYMITDSDQRPASGIYIAHIQEKATGRSVFRKFVIVR
ncbi:MAG: hypothetical protein P8Y62_00630 [candidate division WOR-3 bacterium]